MAHYIALVLVYAMFFLSGTAALIYQVAWVRSLTLVFGGSHLAVTVVLATFMAGLALGGYSIGKCADRIKKPLLLYGLLELGIALFALAFMGLMKIYPSIYIFLAQGKDDAPLYLSLVRVLFSVAALIIPTSFMGGTLPVLSRFVARKPGSMSRHLSFLYGFNTLGAALGAMAAGFFFLRFYSVSATLFGAILTNTAIGLVSILLRDKVPVLLESDWFRMAEKEDSPEIDASNADLLESADGFPFRLILWGIGISGFCALGYEVLWTRILSIVVGVSVYGFTTMLVAFLVGIAMGSGAYAFWAKRIKPRKESAYRSIAGFGIVQIVIGATALLITIYLRELPTNVVTLNKHFLGRASSLFAVRMWSDFILAFSYMFVPAFFMGLAFPLAGKIHAERKKVIGEAVGDILAYNTVGAILGAVASGLFMTYLFGIERSLQMLTVINIGLGLFILLSLNTRKIFGVGIVVVTVAALLFLSLNQKSFKIWDMKYLAIFRTNQLEAFDTPEKIRDAVQNTDILYYAEGAESIVSSIKVKGGEQSFITNGRVEASSHLQGQQHLFALSHLPMLLHQNPRKALVIALGSGMTLGAISIHPGLEELTLVELEPKVLGVARTFEKYNHKVLDNPKLRIIFNDGRNFLLTTQEKYDVITADPIHPWFRGAGYLYTSEYFKLASEHLLPGGILCQWLPIYELTPDDLKSVVKTFTQNFKYASLWLTQSDAELIGSNSPIVIDEATLDSRIAEPVISVDLKRVMMGSADDMLSYFVMGTKNMREFAKDGVMNTDDNLYLEFSAPLSIGNTQVMADNVKALMEHRESILPYLTVPAGSLAQEEQKRKWSVNGEAQRVLGPALAAFLAGRTSAPGFMAAMEELDQRYTWYAPARFLKSELQSQVELNPTLIQKVVLHLLAKGGKRIVKEISAVLVPATKERFAIVFVDNDARVVYGQIYIAGSDKEGFANRFVNEVMTATQNVYQEEKAAASKGSEGFPEDAATLRKIKVVITAKIRENEKLVDK